MSETKNDIVVIPRFQDSQFRATIHFNLAKCTSNISDPDLDAFCDKLKAELGSTHDKVRPMPGKSSASTAKFDPASVGLEWSETDPISHEARSKIQQIVSEFIQGKVETANLLAEAQSDRENEN